MPVYDVTLPDVREASLNAIRDLLRGNLAVINNSVNRDAACPMTWAEAQIEVGDPEGISASRIAIVGGGEDDATDMDVELRYLPVGDYSGFALKVYTNIYVRIHPHEFAAMQDDADDIAKARELARARTVAALRKRILNRPENVVIGLASREYTTVQQGLQPNGQPAYDTLQRCFVQSVRMGESFRGYGNTLPMVSAHLLHVGEIE